MTSQPTDNQHDPADFFDQAIAGSETGSAAQADAAAPPNEFTDTPEGFRSGFISFVGRPNTGKSTLTNALASFRLLSGL